MDYHTYFQISTLTWYTYFRTFLQDRFYAHCSCTCSMQFYHTIKLSCSADMKGCVTNKIYVPISLFEQGRKKKLVNEWFTFFIAFLCVEMSFSCQKLDKCIVITQFKIIALLLEYDALVMLLLLSKVRNDSMNYLNYNVYWLSHLWNGN